MSLLASLLHAYILVLVFRAISSWVPPHVLYQSSLLRSVVSTLTALTEPVLRPLRRILPPVRMGAVGLDLSLFVAIFILSFIANRLV